MAIALIVAGGQGLRMQQTVRKQYLELDGRPVLYHTVKVFASCPSISSIVLVVPPDDLVFCKQKIVDCMGAKTDIRLVGGGRERQESVYNGLVAIAPDADEIVVIHDGVRPFVEQSHIEACVEQACVYGAAILAVPVSDTIKLSDDAGHVKQTVDRTHLWSAQTPQAFRYGLIRAAHDMAVAENLKATDDASLAEARGIPVKLVPGSRTNIKITTPEDLVLASVLIRNRG